MKLWRKIATIAILLSGCDTNMMSFKPNPFAEAVPLGYEKLPPRPGIVENYYDDMADLRKACEAGGGIPRREYGGRRAFHRGCFNLTTQNAYLPTAKAMRSEEAAKQIWSHEIQGHGRNLRHNPNGDGWYTWDNQPVQPLTDADIARILEQDKQWAKFLELKKLQESNAPMNIPMKGQP